MNASAWFSGSFFTGLAWAVFHFLWQGTLLAAARGTRHVSTARRPGKAPHSTHAGLRVAQLKI